jgi:phage tail sheath protein FI
MPEYLAPGVYVEETSYRAKSIEGVSTTTTGFVGPTRYGPTDRPSDVITSLVEFERIYGGREPLLLGEVNNEVETPNFMWHAARAFFEEGGKRLYVSRVFKKNAAHDGHAFAFTKRSPDPGLKIQARYPGAAGNLRVHIERVESQNILIKEEASSSIQSADYDLVVEDNGTKKCYSLKGATEYALAYVTAGSTTEPCVILRSVDPMKGRWRFDKQSIDLKLITEVRLATLTISISQADGSGLRVWTDLAPDPRHRRAGTPDSLFETFANNRVSQASNTAIPIVIENKSFASVNDSTPTSQTSGVEVLALFPFDPSTSKVTLQLEKGDDGVAPSPNELAGTTTQTSTIPTLAKSGLKGFEDIEDISIVAAPGSTWTPDPSQTTDAQAVCNALIRHAQKMKYRIAVLDSPLGASIQQVREFRAKFDSSHAALYYPWVRTLDPATNTDILLPPSGFVAGIYARNDINRAVYKAPANEVVTLALGFEHTLNQAHQEVLNPEGINCFRYFEGRGNRLWGARTVSSDPEWKYVNLRRYFAYLERSIDRSSQFAVFEPNGEALWANIRRMVEDFLFSEWQSGALLGDKPEKAFFVRCDRSTMNQNDLDNGRLVCLIGVAPLRPAEFVIFRIGQFTADRR